MFKLIKDEEMQILFDSRQTKTTPKNNTWGLKIFQGKQNSVNIQTKL